MKEIKSSLQISTPEQDVTFSSPYSDLKAEDWVHLFYSALVGLNYTPTEILTAMQTHIAACLEESSPSVLLTGPPGAA